MQSKYAAAGVSSTLDMDGTAYAPVTKIAEAGVFHNAHCVT
jgi:hypothetical protein